MMIARTSQPKVNLIHQVGPAIWGIVSFNILRIVTDVTKKDEFWSGGIRIHANGLMISIAICYIITFMWRNGLKKLFSRAHDIPTNIMKEYSIGLLQVIVILNPIIFISERLGWIYMGDGFIDYILVNAIYIPLLLLYYTLLRNEVINKSLTDSRVHIEQIKADKLGTDLQLLRSQYHPHFLFNALNTIYFQVDESNTVAKRSLEQLSELLRYQIYNVDDKVSLDQEITYLTSYIAFQQQRLTERLTVYTDFDDEWEGLAIFPLLFQPLIENAFKYVRGEYKIDISLKRQGEEIIFKVSNAVLEHTVNKQGIAIGGPVKSGSGLTNLIKRLDLLYPDQYILRSKREPQLFSTELIINL